MVYWVVGFIVFRDVEFWGWLWCWIMFFVELVVLFFYWKIRY